MAIDPNIIELINADIDGEISRAERQKLEAILDADPEARAMHVELSGLASSLGTLPDLIPPPHLRHTIMASAPKPSQERVSILRSLVATPPLRYAATFAAGAILALSLVSSDRASDSAFNDVAPLVGTISAEIPGGPGVQVADINRPEVAGRVSLRGSGQMLIVDFDLVASGPVEIVASYAGQMVWFNGFAQLESPGAAILAEPGQATMQIDGKRRYALFLRNGGGRDVEINLQFRSAGEIFYDTDMRYRPSGPTG